ncbi:type IV secretion system protein VirB10 [Photobacterium phosphoreum]|uniref:type IV secretion system protein VirB10 n=1 Tax=Photobacterium phosphoreum TaxID=659 RepID=UPI001E5EAEA2|nr:type IV secretion system protein VirB10 [Photobacterium phosphoreum]MCD9477103.1 type IV secretion system protein VirB10 [Photobacterium phosphoreum]MCF2177874.1 type IV secretion system protein VirB10 [Photobacterium phosphoreum]
MTDATDEHNDDQPSQSPPDKKKVALFILFCVAFLGAGGWFYWSKGTDEVKTTRNSNTHTSTSQQTTSNKSSNHSANRTFEFDDEQTDNDKGSDKPTPPKGGDKPPSDTPPPPPPSGKKTTDTPPPIVKKQMLDKSSSAMSTAKSSPPQNTANTGLGIVPQTTNTFDLYAQNGGASQSGIGSLLNTTNTPTAVAGVLYNRDYLLAKGAYIDCVLNTSMNSTVAGMTKCTLTRNIYSDNGNTLLLERGSEVTGEYRANLSQGQSRLFVLWDRVKTPYGVVVNLASPATDSLGAGGVSGYVETHFWQRFGGAMMLSLIDDFAAYVATNGGQNANNFESSSDTAQNMAAEALKSTINIPPTFYKNQGERVGIFIARDIDFSKVYQLKASL